MRTAVQLARCLILLALARPLAFAEQPTPASAASAAQAFARGTGLFEKRDYVGALEAFEEAYRLKPHYVVQCNIARCHEWSGDMVHAREHYQRCLSEGADKAAMAKSVRDSLAEVEARITSVEVASPGGGGTIHVDGREVGRAPGRIAINPGVHVVEVRREGATSASITIKTRGGEQRAVTLVPLGPERPAPVRAVSQGRRTLRQPWFWIAVGATVALVATAAGLGAATVSSRDKYLESRTQEAYDKAVNQRLLTNVCWGLSAAAGATATTLFFFTDFSRGRGAERQPAVTLVGVRGRF